MLIRASSSHRRALACGLLLAAAALPAAAGENAAGEGLDAALAPLAYRVGSWTADVEFLNPDGTVRRTVPSRVEMKPIMEGRAILQRGRLLGTDIETAGIIFRDRETGGLMEVAVSSGEIWDILHIEAGEEKVTYTAEPAVRRGQEVIFRAIDTRIRKDSHHTTGWVSRDGGKTWTQTFRQTNRRAGAREP